MSCYRLMATSFALACATIAAAINPDWAPPVAIDAPGDVGAYLSLAANPATNLPAVSYYSDADLGTLRFAEWNGTTWVASSVTSFVGVTEVFTSLAFVEGRPAIAYYDYQRGRLRYAERDAGGVWQIVTVDGNDSGPLTQIGADCSLAVLPGGEPAIAYVDRIAGALKFARREAGIWVKETVPGAATQVGGKCSLAIVDGSPGISFVRNGRLTFAFRELAWSVSAALDSSASPSSTALTDALGAPVIAYNDTTTGRLMMARYVSGNPALPTSWRRSTADPSAAATAARIVTGPDNTPMVAYHSSDAATGGIKLARAPDYVYPLWLRSTVETPSTRGSHLSFAYVGGKPALAYYDSVARDLLYTTLVSDDNQNNIPDDLEPVGPTGACCIGATCAIGDEATCSAAGGVYAGAGSTCTTNFCAGPLGGCCFGESCVLVSQAICLDVGGAFLGVGVACNTQLCDAVTGACCFENGDCSRLAPGRCLVNSGTYVGDGIACSEGLCAGPTGACCVGETCRQLTSASCGAVAGAYLGDSTSCNDVADDIDDICSGPLGACCDGEACLSVPLAACDVTGGIFLGVGTECTENLCVGPTAACCVYATPAMQGGSPLPPSSAPCLLVTQAACAEASGTYHPDIPDCTANPCSGPTGACCLGAACLVTTRIACELSGGVYLADNSPCSENLCSGPTGGCCVGESCITVSEAACAAAFGVYLGVGAACDAQACAANIGACCSAQQTCSVLTGAQCAAASGQYFGDGTTCTETLCTGSTGACCFGQSCAVVTPEGCGVLDGTHLGEGTECGVDTCVGPAGSCCVATTCLWVPLEACDVAGGTFIGLGILCPEGLCDGPAGGCCVGQTCRSLTAVACDALNGAYLGDGVSCLLLASSIIDLCAGPTGACCDGAVCLTTTSAACNATGGFYFGDGVPCSSELCAGLTGACCLGQTCVSVTAAGCTALEGAFLGESTTCDFSPCVGPAGACCDGETCLFVSPFACYIAGGAYLGFGTACTETLCVGPTGACCVVSTPSSELGDPPQATCLLVTQAACQAAEGTFLGADTACAPNVCGGTTGACCVGETCLLVTPTGCGVAGGIYLGDFTNCVADLCTGPSAACCVPNGNCFVLGQNACNVLDGVWLAGEPTCISGLCDLGACCYADYVCELTSAAGCDGSWQGAGTSCDPNPCLPPGDLCSTAFEIPSLPYAIVGSTCDFTDNYNAVCPYDALGGLDVVYRYTTGATAERVSISLCNDPTNYDSKLYVFAGDCSGSAIFCNDDSCFTLSYPEEDYVSTIGCVTLEPNTTYFIVVDGYSVDDCGTYELTVDTSECPGACCYPDGGCQFTLLENCEGFWQGPDTSCDPSPCLCLGDTDCDGDVDFFDIDPFVAMLGCPAEGNCDGPCPWQTGDVDLDGDVDFFDIDPFVVRLGTTCAGSPR